MYPIHTKCLFAFWILLLSFKSFGQVELSVLAGTSFNYASVTHHPDSVGTAPVHSKVNAGLATTLEANLPMQHNFRLKAGIRLLYKNFAFEQRYNYWGNKIKNQWFLEGFSLETPVHLTYPVVNRRFLLTLGIGAAAVKNWINSDGAGISGYTNNSPANTTYSWYGNFITCQYQPGKNSFSVAGELCTEITHFAFPRFSLGIVWHQDLLKQAGQLTYENRYSLQATGNQQFFFRSKGSFGVERPGYFMVQLKYTFAGKPKGKEINGEKTDFGDSDW